MSGPLRSPARPPVAGAIEELVGGLGAQGIELDPEATAELDRTDPASCAVSRWAASGAMWLTGRPDGPPQWPDGDVAGRLGAATELVRGLARGWGADLRVDPGLLLTQRASARGLDRGGATSAGGSCRLVRTADGRIAVNLARRTDLDLLPAWTEGIVGQSGTAGSDDVPVDPALWDRIGAFAGSRSGRELTARAQLLGLPVGRLGPEGIADPLPWSIHRGGEASPSLPPRPLVVDFSALWSGPLCAHLLGRSGMTVVKVEDLGRPDGARRGDPWLFEQLHAGHQQVTFAFARPGDRRDLRALVDSADVVIEASRPRALAALGLDPGTFLGSRPGRTWVSITGYGRAGPRSNWVAFGDDAAVAGGLVGSSGPTGPVFCADAVADPVTGVYAAVGALASMASGGGHLVDCSMQASSAFVNAGGACEGEHRMEGSGPAWRVFHADRSEVVRPPGLAPTVGVSTGGARDSGP
jgi:hypothetical protein